MSVFRRMLERTLEIITLLLLGALLLTVIGGVVFRTIGASLAWYDEVASVLLSWLTYFGAALAALKRVHLGFPELVLNLPPTVRVSLFAIAEVVVFAFFAVLGWFGWSVLEVLAFDHLASLPWVSQAALQSIIPIGALLFMVAQAMSLPDKLAQVRAGVNPEDKAREEAIREAMAHQPVAEAE